MEFRISILLNILLWSHTLCDEGRRGRRFLLDKDVISCNFNPGICGYTQSIDDDFDWTRQSGATVSANTGPNRDHTPGGLHKGFYIYTEASSPRKAGDKARIKSRVAQSGNTPQSVEFYYMMNGQGIGTLNVYVEINQNPPTSPDFTISGNQGPSWYHGCVDVPANVTYQIIFEGVIGSSYLSDIAIDDIKLKSSPCSGQHLTTGQTYTTSAVTVGGISSLACDFEHELCGYTQDKTDNRDWSRHTGNTTSQSTGPSKDHTVPLGKGYYMYFESSSPAKPRDKARLIHQARVQNLYDSGYYMYFESSSPAKPGDKARLLSPLVSPSQRTQSVRFWYHMYGQDMGTLNIYARSGSSLGAVLFSISGNQGSVWRQACVDIPTGGAPFQLVFEAIRGSSFHGDIAIDDVTTSNLRCTSTTGSQTTSTRTTTDPSIIYATFDIVLPQTNSSVTPGSTTSSQLTTKTSTSSVTCNFDQQTICGYTLSSQSSTVNYTWQWVSGATVNQHTGPARDHTTGRGHYMAAVSLGMTSLTGTRTRLYSPYFDTVGKQLSLDFWYNTFSSSGHEFGAFYLYLDNDGQHGNAIFTTTQALHSTAWREVCINLPTNLRHVRLMFEAVHGSGIHGDIAIDDVTLSAGTCGSSGTTTPSTTSVNGGWSSWTTWSQCSVSCGLGSINRIRKCSSPAPSVGGKNCSGETNQTHDCSPGPCAVWSSWYNGTCSATCGNGTLEQFRHCSSGHDEDCTGSPFRQVPCNNPRCI